MDNQDTITENVKLTQDEISIIRQVIKVVLYRGTPVGYAGDDDEGIDVDEEDMQNVLAKLKQYGYDVHTEHCCRKCGCKYGNDDCTVATGIKKASYSCKECSVQKYNGPEQVDSVDWDEDGEP